MRLPRPPAGLLLAAALYVLLRALILLTNFEETAMPMFELYPMGTLAQLRLTGVHFPLRLYYDNAAGQLVTGLAAIPVYALLGSTYLALKLVPAAMGLATLCLLWWLVDRLFSRRAAAIAALLFALAPPTLTRYSLICSGNHFENLLFCTLALALACQACARPDSRARLFAAAWAAGTALFVFLGALIPVALGATLLAGCLGWRRVVRGLPLALGGFLLGLAPLGVVNWWTSGRGLGFLGAKFAAGGGGRPTRPFLERVGEFLGGRLVEAGWFEPVLGLTRAGWGWIFVGALAVAWTLSLPDVLRGVGTLARGACGVGLSAATPREALQRVGLLPFVLYLPLTAVAFGLSNLRLGGYVPPMEAGGYRYYLPTLLFALVLVAVWSDRLLARGALARVAGLLLLLGALLPGATSLALVDWSFTEIGNGLRYPGYNHAQMSRGLLSARNALAREEIVMRITAWPPAVQEPIVRALGFNLGLDRIHRARAQDKTGWVLDLDALLAPWPEGWRGTMAAGAGTALRFLTRMEARTGDLPELLRRVRTAEEPLLARVHAGAASTNVALVMGIEMRQILLEDAELVHMDLPLPDEFARGFGRLCALVHARGVPSEVELAEALRGGSARPAFHEGWASAAPRR